jgi:proteasome lid subunit RPN8/RPN11
MNSSATLWLNPDHVQQIVAHGQAQFPGEACGILVGENRRVTRVIPAENVSASPTTSYEIDGGVLSAYLPDAIGFYHSHPFGTALPSRSDIQNSCYPDHVYMILGMNDRQNPEFAAWTIHDQRVRRVSIHVGPLSSHEKSFRPETMVEKRVIILSILIGVLVVLIVSLTLLPPAPPIP